MTTVNAPPKAGRRAWLGLAVLCLPTVLATVDISVVFLALPRLSADLHATSTQQLWITDIYGFMIAGFLVTMGSLGDRIGRRKVLLSGAAVFIVASLLAAYSTSTVMLIGARALLGIAAATIMPSVLALMRDMFKDPKQFGAATGVWGTSIMVGVVLGPAIAGLLLGAFWWGSVFIIGVPVNGAAPADRTSAAAGILRREPGASRPGQCGAVAGGRPASHLRSQRKSPGTAGGRCPSWPSWRASLSRPSSSLGSASSPVRCSTCAFFGHRALSPALVLGLMLGFALSGIGLTVTMYMQMVEGLTPLRVGLWLLPSSLAMTVAGNLTPAIARKVRPAYVIAGGMTLAMAGSLVLTKVSSSAGMAVLVVALIITYVGASPAGILSNFLIMSSAPPEKAGSAGSLSSTSGELGVALGVALLGSVSTAVYRGGVTIPAEVPAQASGTAHDSIAGAASIAQHLPGPLGTDLLETARSAFTTSVHTTAVIIAALFLGLAIMAVARLRHIPSTGEAPAVRHDPATESQGAVQAASLTTSKV